MAPVATISSVPEPQRSEQGGSLPFPLEAPARPMDRSAGPQWLTAA